MQRMFATAALAGVVAGSALSGHAAQGALSGAACDAFGATLRNDSLRFLPEVKVQAPHNEQKRARIAGFSQNAETWRRMPMGDVVDVLHTLPAVWVRSLGGFGTATTVGTRGLGAAHTAVFVDGFPMGDAENATIDVSPFSLHRLNTVTIDVGEAPELPVPVRALGASTLHFTTLWRPLRIWSTVGAFGYRAVGAITAFSTRDNCNCTSTAKRQTMIFLSFSITASCANLVDATRQKPGDGLRRCTGRRPPRRNGETPKGDLGEILLDANCPVPFCSMQCKRGSVWTTTRQHCTGGGRGDRAHGSGRQRRNGARKTNSTQRAIRNTPTADEQTATDNKKAGFQWGRRTLCRLIGNGLM
mgnify:CR=1 FL=1